MEEEVKHRLNECLRLMGSFSFLRRGKGLHINTKIFEGSEVSSEIEVLNTMEFKYLGWGFEE